VLEDNQQDRRITAEYLREEVLSRRFRGCALHSWMLKRNEKLNGIKDWPEEECLPPEPTAKELDQRRRLVESVLVLVDGSPDEETMERLNRYMQGKFDDQLWFLLTHLSDPKGNQRRPIPPRRTQPNDSSTCL
jgi:hypothetical protein